MIHVVAGVIYNAQGEILLARRQSGLWEFPGGKCEQGESVPQALARELQEELGIVVQQARPLIRVADKKILLDVWRVEAWLGAPWGREGQTVQWCRHAQDLKKFKFPAANVPIITAVQLPSLYLITPEPITLTDKKFFYRLEACLEGTCSLVQLRAKNLTDRDYCYCAEKALKLSDHYHAQLLLNATPEMALSVGTHGVHLNSKRLYTERPPLGTNLLIAGSCHTLEDIQQANRIKTDFIVLSPVRTTTSHPDAPPLGWHKFYQLTEQANCPVFALGGMSVAELPKSWAHGAQGIAAIRALWAPRN